MMKPGRAREKRRKKLSKGAASGGAGKYRRGKTMAAKEPGVCQRFPGIQGKKLSSANKDAQMGDRA